MQQISECAHRECMHLRNHHQTHTATQYPLTRGSGTARRRENTLATAVWRPIQSVLPWMQFEIFLVHSKWYFYWFTMITKRKRKQTFHDSLSPVEAVVWGYEFVKHNSETIGEHLRARWIWSNWTVGVDEWKCTSEWGWILQGRKEGLRKCSKLGQRSFQLDTQA